MRMYRQTACSHVFKAGRGTVMPTVNPEQTPAEACYPFSQQLGGQAWLTVLATMPLPC